MADGNSETSLEAGFIELAGIVRALHGDWSAPAGGEYDGWSCHDLLAHLSSTEASLARIVESSNEPPRPGAEPFDADRWNNSQIRRRKEASDQDLLNEFDMGTTRLVETLTDMDLKRPVRIGPYDGMPLGEAMAEMLDHQRHHLDDLRAALHRHPEG
jgi:uncharacterized protein (TIGR03083 family)